MGLKDEAVRETGLSDFGPDEFEVGLRVIESDLDRSDLPPALADWLREDGVKNLCTRLRLVAQRKAEPAIAAQEIERPLFVIGLPRTGTTALVDLLAQDPAARSPQQWEFEHLAHLSDPSFDAEAKIAKLEADLEARSRNDAAALGPVAAQGLHTFGARLPEECNTFLKLSMWSASISVRGHMPRYSEWLRLSGPRRPYIFHRMTMQHLQHFGGVGRWTLKSPFHVFDLAGILNEYPNAVFIQTHRDPEQLMASLAGVYTTIRREGEGDPQRMRTATELLEFYGTGMQRALAARQDPALDERVFDISHKAFVNDPLGTVVSVYDRFGWELGDAARNAIESWIAKPAQTISGKRFTLGEFGLDAKRVDEGYGNYRSRFADYF